MLEFVGFFASVVLISASGVMAPGPLFVATIGQGIRTGKAAGLKIAAGHTTVELPLIILIGVGMLSLDALPEFRGTIRILGALGIFAFAGIQFHAILKKRQLRDESKYGSFVTGVFLTGLNPFFLVWWFTIGVKLISDAILLWQFWGILAMFGFHIWMDYVWLFTVSALSAKGAQFLTNRGYVVCIVAINALLVYFGILFIFGI